MSIEITMPKLGFDMQEGTLIKSLSASVIRSKGENPC